MEIDVLENGDTNKMSPRRLNSTGDVARVVNGHSECDLDPC